VIDLSGVVLARVYLQDPTVIEQHFLWNHDVYVHWAVVHESMKPREAFQAAARSLGAWYQDKVKQGIKKFEEAADPNTPLSKEEFVDDLAATSMARLWDVGKTEPIKVGKASPTEGTLPTSVYLVLRYQNDFVAGVKARGGP